MSHIQKKKEKAACTYVAGVGCFFSILQYNAQVVSEITDLTTVYYDSNMLVAWPIHQSSQPFKIVIRFSKTPPST